jgi:V8-like Glu-specific endopeptidase
MAITISNRFVTHGLAAVPALVLTATLTVAVAAGPGASPRRPAAEAAGAADTADTAGTAGHPAAVTVAEQVAVARYWTAARMRAAVPAQGPSHAPVGSAHSAGAWLTGNTAGWGLRWTHRGVVARSTGKVFFTLGDMNYVCSGSAVDSANEDVVLTAAHCVSGGAGKWASNWIFVPGYRDGAQPYGAYTARRFFVSPQWSGAAGKADDAVERYDIAFVTVSLPQAPSGSRPAGTPLPASQPVAFGQRFAGTAYVFGYPAEPPYTGLYPDYCAGRARPGGLGGAWTPCAMTAGDSGGPWFARFSPRTGTGTIVAISTFKISGHPGVLDATALGPAARVLYQEADVSPDR